MSGRAGAWENSQILLRMGEKGISNSLRWQVTEMGEQRIGSSEMVMQSEYSALRLYTHTELRRGTQEKSLFSLK